MREEGSAPAVAALLRRSRRHRGLSQAALALKAGVTRETVYRLEAGRSAHADTLMRIAAVLDLPWASVIDADNGSARVTAHPDRMPLRERRRKLGLTLCQCAAAAKVSVATLSRFERDGIVSRSLCVRGPHGGAFAIHNEGLAQALGFANATELTVFWRAFS